MSKKTGLIIASILLIGGVGIGVAAFAAGGFNYKNNMKIVEKFKENNAQFDSVNKLDFSGVTTDINLGVSEDDKVHINYQTDEYEDYVITNENNTLTIKHKYTNPWYDRWFIYSETPKFDILIPLNTLNNVSINSTTGNITVENIDSIDSFNIKNTTGDIKVNNCDNIVNSYIKSTTGNIEISNSNFSSLSIKLTTGDIDVNSVKVTNKLESEITTGGTFLQYVEAKNVNVDLTTGTIMLVKLISDDIHLKNTSGNIKGSIKGLITDYMITASSTSGNCNLNSTTTGTKTLVAKTTSGNINISFVE